MQVAEVVKTFGLHQLLATEDDPKQQSELARVSGKALAAGMRTDTGG